VSLPESQNSESQMDFVVLAPPSTFVGIEVIWQILQDCDKKSLNLVAPIIDVITKLYHSIDPELSNEDALSISNEFPIVCLQQMKIGASNIGTSEEEKRVFIKTCIILMKSFLADTEKNGTANLKSLSALEKGDYLDKIILQNTFGYDKDVPRFVEISAYSNMTLWELKKIASKKFRVLAKRIEFKRGDNSTKLSELNHAKTLREL
jgi:hypothetical protein